MNKGESFRKWIMLLFLGSNYCINKRSNAIYSVYTVMLNNLLFLRVSVLLSVHIVQNTVVYIPHQPHQVYQFYYPV